MYHGEGAIRLSRSHSLLRWTLGVLSAAAAAATTAAVTTTAATAAAIAATSTTLGPRTLA